MNILTEIILLKYYFKGDPLPKVGFNEEETPSLMLDKHFKQGMFKEEIPCL